MVTTKKFSDPKQFLAYNEAFIDSSPFEHHNLISIIAMAWNGKIAFIDGYNIIDNNGNSILCLWAENNFLTYSNNWTPEMIQAVLKTIDFAQLSSQAFGGTRNLVLEILEQSGTGYTLIKDRTFYKSIHPLDGTDVATTVRLATVADQATLADMFYNFSVEEYAGKSKRTPQEMARVAQEGIKMASVYILEDKGTIFSMLQATPINDLDQWIGMMYTAQFYRGKSYATHLLTQVSAILLKKGFRQIGLIADISNHASLRVFEKAGFQSFGQFISVIIN